ncbi:DUF3293 domain-containing protein [Vibrio sp. T187]|nr:DUF3293 domain-containing protein [Vibrio sp. T187]
MNTNITGAHLIIDSNLWHAYASSYFQFSELPCDDRFIIITAWNPRSAILSIEENRRNNQQLQKGLSKHSYT